MANLGPDDVEEKVLDAALRMARSQATVPPLEEQICPHHKNSQTCEEEVGCRRCRVAIGGQEEGSMRRGGGGGRSGFGQNEGGSPVTHRSQRRPESRSIEGQVGPIGSLPVSSSPRVSQSSRGHPVQGGKTSSGVARKICCRQRSRSSLFLVGRETVGAPRRHGHVGYGVT